VSPATTNTPTRRHCQVNWWLIVRVLCVGPGGRPCPSSRSGGSRGRRPGDLVPDREAVGHHLSVFGRRQQMPTRTEMWSDAAERGPEPVRMPGRGAPFHRPLALPGCEFWARLSSQPMSRCCDESGERFMLVAERAMPWSAWRHGGNASRVVRRGLPCCPAQATAVRGSPTLHRSPTTSTPRNHVRPPRGAGTTGKARSAMMALWAPGLGGDLESPTQPGADFFGSPRGTHPPIASSQTLSYR